MHDKVDALESTQTWTLTPLPLEKKLASRQNQILNITQMVQWNNKAHLVAKGYNQQAGLNYTKTFAHVAYVVIVRSFLALAASCG